MVSHPQVAFCSQPVSFSGLPLFFPLCFFFTLCYIIFLYYWYSKSSLLPFYPCHFSFEPCRLFPLAFCIQFEYLILILGLSSLYPCIGLYRSVTLSSNFFLNHLVQASFLTYPCLALVFIVSVKLQLLSRTPCPSCVPNKFHDIIQILLYSSTSGKFFRKINCLIPKPMKFSLSDVFISVDL